MKAEGATGDQADLCVDRLHTGVGEAVADCGNDPLALLGDRSRQLQEGLQATASRPLQPVLEPGDLLLEGPGEARAWRAQGTAQTTTPCSGQRTLGASASRYPVT